MNGSIEGMLSRLYGITWLGKPLSWQPRAPKRRGFGQQAIQASCSLTVVHPHFRKLPCIVHTKKPLSVVATIALSKRNRNRNQSYNGTYAAFPTTFAHSGMPRQQSRDHARSTAHPNNTAQAKLSFLSPSCPPSYISRAKLLRAHTWTLS